MGPDGAKHRIGTPFTLGGVPVLNLLIASASVVSGHNDNEYFKRYLFCLSFLIVSMQFYYVVGIRWLYPNMLAKVQFIVRYIGYL